ncbi:hypothetical protein LR48_Vigan02g011100 [Vigna angularis]|uniref:Uncharacterized protein n=1 Tax=Phaseolus angularis TaxID=3914 RepID=A0A0L9TU07_PHAAN|nr:hypothetical protein LR48_Vigan02g011100 [Vigna angularis]
MQNQTWLPAFALSESNFDSVNFSSQEWSDLRIEVVVGRIQIYTLGRSFTNPKGEALLEETLEEENLEDANLVDVEVKAEP